MRETTTPGRSPVPAILVSIVVGFFLAVALLLLTAPTASEPVVTGSVMLAFGLGWALMAWLTTRFTAQPQGWMYVPAVALAGAGVALTMLRPEPAAVDLLGWVWPVGLAVLAAWMLVQLRRHLRGAGRWLVAGPVVMLLLIAIAGGLVTIATAAKPPAAVTAGQFVEVGGRTMYLKCLGTGGPVVLLQAGLGGDSSGWKTIQAQLMTSTTVCAYDRAGSGWSDPPPTLQDGEALARDLHELLAEAGVSGPYVLAGHSSGGPYLRVFAGIYPAEVAGLVLIDPQPADAFTALPDYPAIFDSLLLTAGAAPSLARIGLLGPIFGVGPLDVDAARARSTRDEYRALPAVLAQAAKVTSIGAVPLIIVSADTGNPRGWAEAQAAQRGLSTNSVQRVVEGATHESLLEADSTASIQAIRDVLAAVREDTPLS